MNIEDLPLGKNPKSLDFPHFPTRQQAFIWKNWEMVHPKKIAEVLGTTEKNILDAASEMGLNVPPLIDESWMARGYLTVIRNNWHLLNYEQLLQLLGWEASKLAYTLKEEDFLWSKMGRLKPASEFLKFKTLTEDEKEKTAELKNIFLRHFPKGSRDYIEKPFAFISDYGPKGDPLQDERFEFNFIHSFSASYGDVFLNPELDPLPENLLMQYASMGIKGVWFQAILYTLHPIKGAEEFSEGYEIRLKNLSELVRKCAKYGIGLYLYLNEPRCMPDAFYKKFPEWKGVSQENAIASSNCTSRTKEPVKWLEEACTNVFAEVPGLAGAFMITMSENPTHCHSRFCGSICPYCKDRPISDIIAEIVCAAERGIHSSAPDAKVIVWDWTWRPEGEPSDDLAFEYEILEKLPRDIYFMCVSEWGKKFKFGGVEESVMDYSISQVGPSEKSVKLWKKAKECGMKIVAKMQLNNSWEFSAAPYIPVPYLVREHLDNLFKNNINGLMLSWSLGGYPGGNLELINKTPEEIAHEKFGNDASPLICGAWKVFSEAFREFPFHIQVIYVAPMNFGPMNILRMEKTGYNATMIGFPYDDLKNWRVNYPEDVFEEQFRKLSEGWRDGLELLEKAGGKIPGEKSRDFVELENISRAAYCHFRSTYLQIRFVRLRNDENTRKELTAIVEEELELAKELHEIARRDSRIGFEASNHYYYSLNDLREKVLNCEYLKNKF